MAQDAGRQIEVTHPDKPYFPEAGVTKGRVVAYYERIAPVALPLLAGRPLVLQRFPEGIGGHGFYQKNTPPQAPGWLPVVELATVEGGTTRYVVAREPAALVHLANQAAIVLHTLLSDAATPQRPVEVVWDLDPSGADRGPVRAAAAALRDVLDGLGLAPRVKSTGSRGVHVLVDVVDDDADFDGTRGFALAVARFVAMEGDHTVEIRKAARRGRLFIDVYRNGVAGHIVAPYSLRALPVAPVAAPLTWEEVLAASFDPQRITVQNVFRRLAQRPDPWAGHPRPTATIAEASERFLAAHDPGGEARR